MAQAKGGAAAGGPPAGQQAQIEYMQRAQMEYMQRLQMAQAMQARSPYPAPMPGYGFGMPQAFPGMMGKGFGNPYAGNPYAGNPYASYDSGKGKGKFGKGKFGKGKGKGKGKKGKDKDGAEGEEGEEKEEGEEGKEGEEEEKKEYYPRGSPIVNAQKEARLRFEKDVLDRIQGRWTDEADPKTTYVVEGNVCSVSSGDGGRGFRNRLSVYGVEMCWDARRFWHNLNLQDMYAHEGDLEKLEWNPAKDSPPTQQIVWLKAPPLPEGEEEEAEGEEKKEEGEEKKEEEKTEAAEDPAPPAASS